VHVDLERRWIRQGSHVVVDSIEVWEKDQVRRVDNFFRG